VAGGKEFTLLVFGSPNGAECDAVWFEDHAMDEIVHRLANEGIAEIVLAEKIIAVDADAAAGSDVVERAGIVEALERAADGMNEIRVRAGGNGNARSGRGDVRVAAEVAIINRIKPGSGAVVAAEPI